ncbi:sensor domain-containing diguanylate cyclase [Murimonas intestini]|uniref:Diguanylate cyclase (GGDEF)-like protein n=1 Tax=Murimonas intestini TaxID=1337051 RepID=A0AB73T0E1_9FIRM|nr:sensor domain-containing diguanylate cyclase [Murimonas intestini]MCR1842364.1 sensor domain-containing diguanylate cyclase [Murimonas intestini]MCR1867713.1 sensor domain-containing diguanylate cyclase [Murimonas intestini]MCR1885975.1 sensor domain-containing diguanylate cyclase [Murimonas intestini]
MDKTEGNTVAKRRYSKKVLSVCAVIILMIAGCIWLNMYYYNEVQSSLMQQTYSDLKKENERAESYLSGRIKAKIEWLDIIAAFCDMPDGSGDENWRQIIDRYKNEKFQFGIADANGTLYFAAGNTVDVSGKDYYQRVMMGERVVSQVLKNDFGNQDGVVMAVPIIRNDEIIGAVCLEYTTLELGEYINDSKMSESGANLVFDKSGEVTASYPGMESFDTVYDMLAKMDYKEEGVLEKLKEDVKEGRSGYAVYYNNNKMRLIYYAPADIKDWTILSLVVTDSYETTIDEIRFLSAASLIGTIIMLAVIAVLTVYVVGQRRKEMQVVSTDALTGVLTREAARKLVEQKLRKGYEKGNYACIFMDIDDFKKINDTYGHDRGDRVLIEAGEILKRCIKRNDIVCRYGGDEFCVWVNSARTQEEIEALAEDILAAFRGTKLIHVCLGIALRGMGEKNYDLIVKRADEALYCAKRQGKNRYCIKK